MVSLVATDEAGRYRLENIPPGRYYVTAGRVDFPTYFPGALDMSNGTIVSVTSKATISDLNFSLQDASIRTAANSLSFTMLPVPTMPILVTVENGGKQPVSANGYYVTLSLTQTIVGRGIYIPLNGPAFSAPISSAVLGAEYRVTVDNLPDGYVLKSLSFGSTDLRTDTLKMTAANFPQLTNTNAPLVSSNVISFISVLGTLGGGAATPVSGVSSNAIRVTLGMIPPAAPPLPGVRITGRAPVTGSWEIYRGDVPGTFYADGSFELRGVPPGRHVLVLQENSSAPRFYAAVANVGDRDLDEVVLNSTGILPTNAAVQPATAGGPPARSGAQTLAGLIGRVVEEADGKPISQGGVTVLGRTMTTIPVGKDGKFIIPRLLPGSYDLRIEVFEHFTLYKTVVISDQDTQMDFAVRSNLATAEERTILEAESQR